MTPERTLYDVLEAGQRASPIVASALLLLVRLGTRQLFQREFHAHSRA